MQYIIITHMACISDSERHQMHLESADRVLKNMFNPKDSGLRTDSFQRHLNH